MKKLKHILPAAVLLLTIACTSNDGDQQKASLVFGHFYGECMGEGCVEIFRLDNQLLFEDVRDQYPAYTNPYEGDFSLSRSRYYQRVSELWDIVPEKLYDESDTIIGQPDAGDWGGIYLAVSQGTVDRYWLIDQKKSNVPEYLHELIDSVNAKIAFINQNQ